MTFPKPKKLQLVLWVTAAFLALSLALLIYFVTLGAWDGAFYREPLAVFLYENETILVGEKEGILPSSGGALSLRNEESVPLRITVLEEEKILFRDTLQPGESKTVTAAQGAILSLVAEGEESASALLGTSNSALTAISLMPDGGDLVFLREIALEDPVLSAPFRWFGSFSFSSLTVETEKAGRIVLDAAAPFTAPLYVQAARCKIYTDGIEFPFARESYDFYLKARSHNGASLDPLAFPVTQWQELERLCDDALLPRFSEGGTVSVLKAFSAESDLTLSGHGSFVFEAKVDFGKNTLCFSSSEEGNYSVKTTWGTEISAASLIFDAPRSRLYWEGEGTLPSLRTVEKYSNVSHYNGTELGLGGLGTATPILTLPASENEALEQDVTFSVTGNTLQADLPFLFSAADLNEAVYHLNCSEGSVSVEGRLSDGVIVTVDELGLTRRYAVEVTRAGLNIPVVSIQTENGVEISSKSQYVSADFAIDGGSTGYSSMTERHIRIRGRGNSTWKWEKKPFKIHFDEPTSVFGLPAAEEWILLANYADKSLMRNHLAKTLSDALSFSYSPDQVYVDLFLNGEYLGVYSLGEHLEEGEGRVEVSYDMSSVDCGYFLEAGGVVSGVDVKGMNFFHADLIKFALIKGPEYNALTSEQFDFIQNYVTTASQKVRLGEGYEEYVDMESFVDWLIMIELSNNIDCAYRRSTYMTKNPGEKLTFGPVWDFDLAFGNFSRDDADYDVWVSTADDDYVGTTWSTFLLEDPEFRALFKARWLEVRDLLLQTARDTIRQDYELLKPSAELNFQRWKILGVKVAFEPQSTKYYKTYDSQIDYLENFLEQRAAWLDEQVAAW